MKILVTGGAGYIGSHFVKILSENNFDLTVIDNLSRGHRESIPSKVLFEFVDLQDYSLLLNTLKKNSFDAVVHFAAFAYVGESVENPKLYYQNNVVGSFNLIKACLESNINKFVFSSTCSLYGNPEEVPIGEHLKPNPINPYARTKFIIENILRDFDLAYGLKSVSLRYFNAAGADLSGKIGESHNPEPHLIPNVINTALRKNEKVLIFGDDYDTKDGTCIRDYIHVNDLGDAHLKALNYLFNGGNTDVVNLGTGEGYSVLEIVETTERITKNKVNKEITKRRPGDPAILIADNKKAKKVLGWVPKFNLEDIILSAYNWHKSPKF